MFAVSGSERLLSLVCGIVWREESERIHGNTVNAFLVGI
jgi:hypothetical protein